MSSLTSTLGSGLHAVETFFDRVKLGYKWRYQRFGPIKILAYRGFGTADDVYLEGRVLDDPPVRMREEQTRWQNVRDTIQRIETDEIPGARVYASFLGEELVATTDQDGFFEVRFQPGEALPADRAWHEVELELLAPEDRTQDRVRATGHVIVPRPQAEFGIISDMDDTVIRTGATSRLQMARVVLLNSAKTRMPFEGVAAFYRALQKGPDGRGTNPIFYISSSPVNFYGHFEHFMDVRDIPFGPILLKDFGFSREKLFTSGHHTHKLSHIRTLLDAYPKLPFVLVGDSGQQDAEIYREAIERHGADRIRAIYIRDVTPNVRNERDETVQEITEHVRELGVPMVLVQDTTAAAEHAVEHGLVQPQAVDEVRADRHEEEQREESPTFWEKLIV